MMLEHLPYTHTPNEGKSDHATSSVRLVLVQRRRDKVAYLELKQRDTFQEGRLT